MGVQKHKCSVCGKKTESWIYKGKEEVGMCLSCWENEGKKKPLNEEIWKSKSIY